MATLNQFPAIGKGLIKSAHNQAFLTPYNLYAIQILNSLDIRFTKTPVPGAKMHPEMPGKKILFKFCAIVGHSVRGGGPLLQNYFL